MTSPSLRFPELVEGQPFSAKTKAGQPFDRLREAGFLLKSSRFNAPLKKITRDPFFTASANPNRSAATCQAGGKDASPASIDWFTG
jgi:hypothetical protein